MPITKEMMKGVLVDVGRMDVGDKLANYLAFYNSTGWPDYDKQPLAAGLSVEFSKDDDGKHYMDLSYDISEGFIGQTKTHYVKMVIPDPQPERLFVTRYVTTREYGGPEEGGWYFDYDSPIESYRAINQEHAEAMKAILVAEMDIPEHDRYSVIGPGDPKVVIEKYLPVPASRPHYE